MTDSKNLHLAFDARTLDYVVNCIAARPYAECAGVLRDIETQVQAQQQKGPDVPGLPVLNDAVTLTQ
jgi:hypothetical protein